MKLLISILAYVLFINPLWGQSKIKPKEVKEEIEINQKDSTYNYLMLIDAQTNHIANAYNDLSGGLSGRDSLPNLINKYSMVVKAAITNIEVIEVAPHLLVLKNAYLEWIEALKVYFIANSAKLIEYNVNKRNALAINPDADIKYIDKQISDFFEEMDNVQNQWRTLFILERSRLKEQQEQPVITK